jgi:hypothetical protein
VCVCVCGCELASWRTKNQIRSSDMWLCAFDSFALTTWGSKISMQKYL